MYFIKIPFFDLEKTYSTNLCTGWYRLMKDKYCIVDGSNFVAVQQGYKGNFGFSCSEEDFYKYWYKYFDLRTDYMQYNYSARTIGGEMKRAAIRAEGVRIPQQNLVQTIVREVFNDIFDDKTSIAYEAIFRQSFHELHRNSTRGSGQFKWYSLPEDNEVFLKAFGETVEVFKKTNTKGKKKDIIWCLRTIKNIISDLEWYDFEVMDTMDIIDVFTSYQLSRKTAAKICIKCFSRFELFTIDKTTKRAVRNIDSDYQWEDVHDFRKTLRQNEDYYCMSAYVNELIKWDLLNPPKNGDELLWE